MADKDITIKSRYANEETQTIPKNIGMGLYAFRCFNIIDEDVVLGLRHIKNKVKKEFKQLAKYYHPDTSNNYRRKQNRPIIVASRFKDLDRMRKRILKLKTMPLTIDNLETVLDINKGYKSTRDVVLPWD